MGGPFAPPWSSPPLPSVPGCEWPTPSKFPSLPPSLPAVLVHCFAVFHMHHTNIQRPARAAQEEGVMGWGWIHSGAGEGSGCKSVQSIGRGSSSKQSKVEQGRLAAPPQHAGGRARSEARACVGLQR